MDQLAIEVYQQSQPKADIVLIGVYHAESISEDEYLEEVECDEPEPT